MRLACVIALTACSRHAPPVDETLTFTVDGLERTVIVHAPGNLGEAALVFDLHGSGALAANQQAASGMAELADRERFVIAYPQAGIPFGSGFQWHLPGEPLVGGGSDPGAPDDVAFIAQAIRAIDAQVRIDHRRIYATGLSGGARMASQLGCDLPAIAAIAPVAGVRFPDHCAHAASVIAFHGTADETNPYDGNGSPYWTYSVPVAMQRWAANDGCDASPTIQSAAPATVATYEHCRGGALVQLHTLDGAGHDFPHGIDWRQLAWDAFRSHPLP